MIDFIAHDFWSAAWLGCLTGAGAYVLWTGERLARRILWCFIANWLATRAIVSFAPDSLLAWIALDGATVVALVIYGRSRAAEAVALLFAIILGIDNLTAWGVAGFSQAAAASDLLGFIGLLIMAGAATHDGGKLERRGAGGFGRCADDRPWGAAGAASGWGAISARSGSARPAVGRDPKAVP